MTLNNPTFLRALLVDRDEETRSICAQHLRLAAFEIDEAGDGREGLAKALTRHYDVIVTDTQLPGFDGYELCRLLRRDTVTRAAPIVVVTRAALASDRERACHAGADSVLMKPCLPETLRAEIQRVIHASLNTRRRSLVSATAARRPVMSRSHQRGDTSTPPIAPPALRCPQCDTALLYRRSHVGGVSARHPEQWDYFECPGKCGRFQYRQRTRKLRAA